MLWDCWKRNCNLILPAFSQEHLIIPFKVFPATLTRNIIFNCFTSCPILYGLYHEMTKDLKGRMKEGKTGRYSLYLGPSVINRTQDDS